MATASGEYVAQLRANRKNAPLTSIDLQQNLGNGIEDAANEKFSAETYRAPTAIWRQYVMDALAAIETLPAEQRGVRQNDLMALAWERAIVLWLADLHDTHSAYLLQRVFTRFDTVDSLHQIANTLLGWVAHIRARQLPQLDGLQTRSYMQTVEEQEWLDTYLRVLDAAHSGKPLPKGKQTFPRPTWFAGGAKRQYATAHYFTPVNHWEQTPYFRFSLEDVSSADKPASAPASAATSAATPPASAAAATGQITATQAPDVDMTTAPGSSQVSLPLDMPTLSATPFAPSSAPQATASTPIVPGSSITAGMPAATPTMQQPHLMPPSFPAPDLSGHVQAAADWLNLPAAEYAQAMHYGHLLNQGQWEAALPACLEGVNGHTVKAIRAAAADAKPIATPAPAVGSTSLAKQAKITDMPRFNGHAVDVLTVTTWLTQVDLQWQCRQLDDPVLFACLHLDGDAAIWRELVLKISNGNSLAGISKAVFKQQFFDRFVPYHARVKALQQFKQLRQITTVQAYTIAFEQQRQALLGLPEIAMPDDAECASQFFEHLKPDRKTEVKARLTASSARSLAAVVAAANQSEEIELTLGVHAHASHTTSASVSKDKPTESSVSQGVSPAATNSGSRQNKRSRPGPSGADTDGKRARPTRPEGADPRAHKIGDLFYPNKAYAASPSGDVARYKPAKCTYCTNFNDRHPPAGHPKLPAELWHATTDCPAKHFHAVSAAAIVTVATADDASQAPAFSSQHPQCPATVTPASPSASPSAYLSAAPYKGLTMLFAGAVKLRKELKRTAILVDSGSTHCFISQDWVSRLGPAGTAHTVTTAAGDQHVACSYDLSIELAGQSFAITAIALRLPSGVGLILGNDWCKHQRAELSWKTDPATCTFGPDMNRTTCDVTAIHKAAYYNHQRPPADTTLCSASSAHRAVDSSFLVLVTEQGHVAPFCAHTEASASAEDKAEHAHIEDPALGADLKQLLHRYNGVFPANLPADLPPNRGVHLAIPLQEGSIPPTRRLYRLSAPEREEMERQIQEMLSKGWIRPSCSPYGSPILFVKKKDGGMRMCVDFRMLNKQTIRNNYPLPRIDDLLDRLEGATIYSCLDMQQAYHQVRLSDQDTAKTAFTTPQGLFEYLVMPFGLTNAPATFQRLINDVLGDCRSFCMAYLDDVLVFSRSPAEHLHHLERILEKLDSHKLYAKLSKCSFALSSVKFLGHVVSAQGISPDPSKVQLVQDWPMPGNVADLRSFMGLASYFRKFLPDFASSTACLTRLFKKDVRWDWTPACQAAFDTVKALLTSAPVLKLPDHSQEFTIIADASGVGIGAVLLQGDRPIAFDGRKLTDTELKWSATEQEMLAVVHHVQKWRCYLEGRHFLVVTDHEPNTWFNSQKTLSPRQHRWYEHLGNLDFTWQYRPGRLNMADPLSRHPIFANSLANAAICAVATRSQHKARLPVTAAPQGGGITAHAEPPEVGAAKAVVPASSTPSPSTDTSNSTQEGTRLPLPNTPFNTDAMQILQDIRDGYTVDPLYDAEHADERAKHGLSLNDQGLWIRSNLVAVPANTDIHKVILRELHCSPYAGHFGIHRTLELIQRYYWWPHMQAEIAEFIKGCVPCQRSKPMHGPTAGKLLPLPVPSVHWEDISMDFVGPLPTTPREYDSILVVVDRLSKMAHFLPCKQTITAEQLARLLEARIFSLHGMPKSIVSDRGPQFMNAWISALYKRLGTKQSPSTAYHPESDGQTERVNRVLSEMLRHFVNKSTYDNWDENLPLAEFAHNNAKSSATGQTPFFICYGTHPRLPVQLPTESDLPSLDQRISVSAYMQERHAIVAHAQKAMEAARQRMAAQVDPHRQELSFQVGDLVSLKTKHLMVSTLPSRKLFPKWIGPMRVQRIINSAAYMLELPKTWRAHNVFHVSLLKPYLDNGESVEPVPYTLIGGADNEFEVEVITDFKPKTPKRGGQLRKVRDLSFHVKWLGLDWGADAWQPWSNLKGTCDAALTALATKYQLPADLFHKGSSTLPAHIQEPHTDLPSPPPVAANTSDPCS